jgi:hypothetical protein
MKKQAIILTAVWTAAAAALILVILLGGGIRAFAGSSLKVALATGVYMVALVIQVVFVFLNRRHRRGGMIIRDELDDEVQKRASVTALSVVMAFVYGLGVVLWEVFREAGSIPVGWAYVVAISAIIVGSLAHAVATLLIHRSLYADA